LVFVLLSLVVVLGLIGWTFSQRTTDHWHEVNAARRHLATGHAELAFQAVSGIRDDRPGAAEGLTLAAEALLSLGNVSPARRVLERALKMKPDQPDAIKMLAAIYLAAGEGQRSVSLLKEAAELDPRDFRPWYALGKVYHDLGNLGESADAYFQALRRSPPVTERKESQIGRIRSLLDSNRGSEAIEDLAELRKKNADDPQVLALGSRLARDLGRIEESIELADRALACDADNSEALLARARTRFQLRQQKQALEDLEHAVRVNRNDLGALQLLGQVQQSLGMSKEAASTQVHTNKSRERISLIDRLSKVIDQNPEDPEPRWRLGKAAMEGEMFELAFQCFQAALDLDPGYRPARDALDELRHDKRFDLSTIKAARPLSSGRRSAPSL
jgi:cytochrome c-type biogenesis protein CcmH/NrfG